MITEALPPHTFCDTQMLTLVKDFPLSVMVYLYLLLLTLETAG